MNALLSEAPAADPLVADEPLASAPPAASGQPAHSAVETLAESLAVLLGAAVLQRLIGFVRSMLFCRWLPEEELGQWDLVIGFLTLAAPLVVAGLPGSFGRYLEHYRRQGQLRLFLRRTTYASVCLVLLGVALIAACPQWFAWLVLGDGGSVWLIQLVAACLISVIAFNFLVELFSGLRMFRVVSQLNFGSSVAFAVFGLALLWHWPTVWSVIAAYALACTLSCLVVVPKLRQVWRQEAGVGETVRQTEFWRRLVPFAAWLWVTNLLFNLFDIVDRYMLVHLSGLSEAQALAEVGAYHSSRIVPLLLVSLAAMLSQTAMPHLTADWEAGERTRVGDRLNLILKLTGLGLTAAGAVILTFAPLMFERVFEGKYASGLAVLPWTISYCVWSGLVAVAATYLWCAERARLVSVALGVGLALNIVVNLLLVPRIGLMGAVLGTALANLVALMLVYLFGHWVGWRIDMGTIVVSLLPLLLPCGAWAVGLALAAAVGQATRCDWVFDPREKRRLMGAIRQFSRKLRGQGKAAAV